MRQNNLTKKLLFTCFLVTILFFAHLGFGQTRQVCEIGCPYNTIQVALNDSQPGDIIEVKNGKYVENLTITKSITILGTKPEWTKIFASTSNTPLVQINTGGGKVILKNITFQGKDKNELMAISENTNLTLHNCELTDGVQGLSLNDSSILKAKNTLVNQFGLAITLKNRAEATFIDCEIFNSKLGFKIQDSAVLTLITSTIEDNSGPGIITQDTALANVYSSLIATNKGGGIKLKDLSRLNLKESKISENQVGGVLLSDSAHANLSNNEIINNSSNNLSVISKHCGFSGPAKGFYGSVTGEGNRIVPANSTSICPERFSVVNSNSGGTYSYLFKPGTFAFIGLIGAATLYFILFG